MTSQWGRGIQVQCSMNVIYSMYMKLVTLERHRVAGERLLPQFATLQKFDALLRSPSAHGDVRLAGASVICASHVSARTEHLLLSETWRRWERDVSMQTSWERRWADGRWTEICKTKNTIKLRWNVDFCWYWIHCEGQRSNLRLTVVRLHLRVLCWADPPESLSISGQLLLLALERNCRQYSITSKIFQLRHECLPVSSSASARCTIVVCRCVSWTDGAGARTWRHSRAAGARRCRLIGDVWNRSHTSQNTVTNTKREVIESRFTGFNNNNEIMPLDRTSRTKHANEKAETVTRDMLQCKTTGWRHFASAAAAG